MTTPMNVYGELAAEYGGIDPDDDSAVIRFFEKDVYALPEYYRHIIIQKLFDSIELEAAGDIDISQLTSEIVPLLNSDDYPPADEHPDFYKMPPCKTDVIRKRPKSIISLAHPISGILTYAATKIYKLEHVIFMLLKKNKKDNK